MTDHTDTLTQPLPEQPTWEIVIYDADERQWTLDLGIENYYETLAEAVDAIEQLRYRCPGMLRYSVRPANWTCSSGHRGSCQPSCWDGEVLEPLCECSGCTDEHDADPDADSEGPSALDQISSELTRLGLDDAGPGSSICCEVESGIASFWDDGERVSAAAQAALDALRGISQLDDDDWSDFWHHPVWDSGVIYAADEGTHEIVIYDADEGQWTLDVGAGDEYDSISEAEDAIEELRTLWPGSRFAVRPAGWICSADHRGSCQPSCWDGEVLEPLCECPGCTDEHDADPDADSEGPSCEECVTYAVVDGEVICARGTEGFTVCHVCSTEIEWSGSIRTGGPGVASYDTGACDCGSEAWRDTDRGGWGHYGYEADTVEMELRELVDEVLAAITQDGDDGCKRGSQEIVNLTPHDITIVGEGARIIPRSGEIARVSVTREQIDAIYGIPIYTVQYGDVVGLPSERQGVAYIVSALVAMAAPDRSDLYSPGELVRDDSGQPIGCRGLAWGESQ